VTTEQIKQLSEKWFGPIPAGKKSERKLTVEPRQTEKRILNVEADVPSNAIYKSWHMPGRFTDEYYASDLLSDILSRGHSSRFYQQLVQEKEIFTSVSSFVSGTIDPGMLVVSGRVKDGITLEQGEEEIEKILQQILKEGVKEEEVEKVKNQAESSIEFGEVEVINRAMNLAFSALSGDANLVNLEGEKIKAIKKEDINNVAKKILREDNSSVLYYRSKRK